MSSSKKEILQRYKEAKKSFEEKDLALNQKITCAADKYKGFQSEMDRVANVAQNTNIILKNYERDFYRATQLTIQDDIFLFFAIALQCTRWFLIPRLSKDYETTKRSERHDAGVDGKKEREERKKKVEDVEKNGEESDKYMSIKKMFLYPVPYDAMKGTERIVIPGVSKEGKNLYGGNHHSATLGHDPILGYSFGVANIMTRTITFNNPQLQTCNVCLTNNTYINPMKYQGQFVSDDISLMEVYDRVKTSVSIDMKRLPAAVVRHRMHLASDKYCKDGLPIPFLDAERAQELLKQDWNSEEFFKLSKLLAIDNTISAVISIFINVIVEQLHKMCYRESMGISKSLYEVKTHRILEIANIISSSSNLLYSSLSTDISTLDIGGLIVTLNRIRSDEEIIRRIKYEFIYGNYFDLIRGDAR